MATVPDTGWGELVEWAEGVWDELTLPDSTYSSSVSYGIVPSYGLDGFAMSPPISGYKPGVSVHTYQHGRPAPV